MTIETMKKRRAQLLHFPLPYIGREKTPPAELSRFEEPLELAQAISRIGGG